jgi:endonuclease G
MENVIARLKSANARIEQRDEVLREELLGRRDAVDFVQEGLAPTELMVLEGQPVDRTEFELETIVLRTGRPVLAILRNEAQLIFTDPESQVWKQRLQTAAAHLVSAAQAVGRIEVEGHSLAWLGTGWLVAPNVIVTNRHVAGEFGRRKGDGFVFKQAFAGGSMAASIDFLEEFGRTESATFAIEDILHIEDSSGPDLAFLKVTQVAGLNLATPIALSAEPAEEEMVAVIGYPARDSRIPDQPLMDQIFGDVYDKKRLAPGVVTRVEGSSILHDCSTLGGNSGSVVLSLGSGEAVGLHFAGRFLQANFAVASTVVARRLDEVSSRGTGRRPPLPPARKRPEVASPQSPAAGGAGMKVSYVFPLRVTIEVGEPYPDSSASPPAKLPGEADLVDDDEVFTEAVPADYRDREGYQADFLGDGAEVPLPRVTKGASDVLTYSDQGATKRVLPYEHFSVLMSRSRRMCRYSAVNIDGKRSKSKPRVGWRTDPRIPADAQIRKECYGDPPKFSRGHMTRREDPVWGTDGSATKGNADSMHVTNAVPQMQPFNAGIWLELENYALQNARKDDMKISVFTGPFLSSDDPVMFGVMIPLEFWKVIAFIHDETGELCATGYTMSQQDFLSEEEFVFGRHKTNQASIASIEERAGLSFGNLAELDPFEEEERVGGGGELTDLEQIQFVKRR